MSDRSLISVGVAPASFCRMTSAARPRSVGSRDPKAPRSNISMKVMCPSQR
jgi:hypothetical protein